MESPDTTRILYIEDDLGLARLFQRRIRRFGYEVDIARDGEQGLSMYETGSYHLLFVDHQMPGCSGLEVIRRLAQAGPLPATIMITGAGDETVAVEAIKLGAIDYVIKDGNGRYFELIPSMIDRALAGQRLLEEKRKADEALLESEARFKSLAENIQEVFWLSSGREFMYVSPAYEVIWGKSCESLYLDPDSFLQSVHPEDREAVIAGFESRQRAEIEFRISRPDGATRWIGSRLFPMAGERGKAPDKAGIAEDITERKKSEQILIQSERLKAIGELAWGVADNFNNLLQIIMGSANLLSSNLELGDLTAAKADIDQILESSRSGAETVRRLQTFARSKTGRFSTEAQTFDLSELVWQAIEMSKIWWKTIPEREGISLNMAENLGRHCMVQGRQNEIFEVVINLIRNAVEALPGGGDIRVSTVAEDGWVTLTVEDNGVGVAEQNLGKIFQPFFTTKGCERAGMGLAGSYGIVTRHRGEITVRSSPREGATFTIRLPESISVEVDEGLREYVQF
jgi:two-component system, cell cycle sensor histidine kinase and response regulator CckA